MVNEQIYVIKADGTKELFDIDKLERSLKKAGASSRSVQDIVEHTKSHIKSHTNHEVTTHDLYKHAFELLEKAEKPIALKYSLKRAIMELGPSGFPFEDFVAEIFRQKGFKAETGKIVRGFCVEHEVDVVAWNDEKLIMVEAKFHNELGIKSDLKIALYVKARFDDLRKMTFRYGKERNLDEGWLVTNTKFTSTAIEYGSCQGGLRMIGWNYPPVGNLHDMILESKLHPLTCLLSLNGREKKELLDKGVVLCKTILLNPDLLITIGLNSSKSQKVIEEIESL
ncbi:MAG: ATP-cone domain-containing protein [Parcubacteria group bacterium Gr01-1014_46]|nr:MAG: ATP-cone domain-containing protein [Parcubacteria group bacterium Gr01-1014_46]